ncbi:MAG: NAD-dependent epimerase/dehydratase family protein [bacterium]|nr:NAD-dependent epimerase/dehydratase family protein [bacterium]
MVIDPIIKEDVDNIIAAVGLEFGILAGKTILITGANGFLPSYLVDTVSRLNETVFSKSPTKVVAVTRRPAKKNDRLVQHIGDPNVIFSNQDVGKNFIVPKGVDYIIHGASKASPVDFMKDPIDTIDANVAGTRVILEYAAKNKTKGLLFISSSEVYGDPDPKRVPIKESYFGSVNPIGTRSSYQESKRFSETLCYNFFKTYGIPAKIARCFLTYGPRMRLHDGRVIPDFMYNGLSGKDIEMKAGPGFERAFSYVSDTVEQFWRVLLLGRSGEAYNVGSDKVMTIAGLAELFVKIFDNRIKARTVGKKSQAGLVTAPKKVAPDLSKIRKELGYKTKFISVEGGLRRMKEWCELYRDSIEGI